MDSRNLTAKPAKSRKEDEQLSMLSDKENNNKSGGDELDRAATKIQSTFRGYKTRKNLKKTKSNENLKSPAAESKARVVKKRSNTSSNCEENVMADKSKRLALINDPQVAATKIQSTFRGYKTRKQLESRTNKFPRKSSSSPSPLHDNEKKSSTSETSAPLVSPSEQGFADCDAASALGFGECGLTV